MLSAVPAKVVNTGLRLSRTAGCRIDITYDQSRGLYNISVGVGSLKPDCLAALPDGSLVYSGVCEFVDADWLWSLP